MSDHAHSPKPSSKSTPPPRNSKNSVPLPLPVSPSPLLTSPSSGIFEESITPYIDRPDPTDPSTTPTDIDVYLSVKEKGRLSFKSGTNVGNTEGDAYGSVIFKNAFGGAETLAANATYGTRTRSSYQGTFSTPLFSNPDLNLELGGVASSTQNTWASHEEVLKAAWTKLRWLAGDVHRHEVEYNGSWRQITGLASNASPTVRMDAGDSVKSSVAHTWLADWRDNPLMPQYGVYAKTVNEIAGIGPLGGDVAFWKGQVETQGAVPVRIPGVRNSGVTFTTGLRAGILCPLTLAGRKTPEASRINDRFLLGGPTDVRGFREAGLGPRDGPDSVGGDVYTAWSANLLFPLPGLGWNETFKGQIFMNCGRLLALQGPEASGAEKEGDGSSVGKRLKSTIGQLADGYPSTSAGLGLVYAHPIARLEVNLVLPLVVRKGEAARKGLQWGIGINFL